MWEDHTQKTVYQNMLSSKEEVQDREDKGDSILRSKFYRGLKGHKSGEAVRI